MKYVKNQGKCRVDDKIKKIRQEKNNSNNDDDNTDDDENNSIKSENNDEEYELSDSELKNGEFL